jgi:hypothetical protein
MENLNPDNNLEDGGNTKRKPGNPSLQMVGVNTRFEKGKSGNSNGRPPSFLRELEDKLGISFKAQLTLNDKQEIADWLLEQPLEVTEKLAKNKSTPIFIINLIAALRIGIRYGNLTAFQKIIEFTDRTKGNGDNDGVFIFSSGFSIDSDDTEDAEADVQDSDIEGKPPIE